MAQLQPDKEVTHGWHIDKFWPGLIHSVWRLGPLELRRERKFHDQHHTKPESTAWLLVIEFGKDARAGFKFEYASED